MVGDLELDSVKDLRILPRNEADFCLGFVGRGCLLSGVYALFVGAG
jgi:hypothetical protein